jgi:hypothetical protein
MKILSIHLVTSFMGHIPFDPSHNTKLKGLRSSLLSRRKPKCPVPLSLSTVFFFDGLLRSEFFRIKLSRTHDEHL